ncbi:hypothetical protein F4825DRAFT_432502 [Nemania diffusa]|nr:hypothetical protein F4825DRAFT_432502 [Nemania diffusa]
MQVRARALAGLFVIRPLNPGALVSWQHPGPLSSVLDGPFLANGAGLACFKKPLDGLTRRIRPQTWIQTLHNRHRSSSQRPM